ncbi:alpha-glucosidase [Psychrobacillus sp. BL-248-WT-3]|uniref:glycoside hydrolase family 13 protein n=1 Tax=Psychrobacillus sp. BL-248-WT-3 TaxID=2725306 RepID=UPI00146C6F85|nr:alpha-glucosidase [Psychrobacillus sp. BL-248-WT-3]NME05390.1 alpha-glucosidase [Psychrobacillus sp. BL-248-WT-3]
MNRNWWKEAVSYQVYPRSFMDSNGDGIGDLRGIITKLDYLKDLGIDVIWVSPFFKSPNADNGYDISDYQGISEQFGDMKDFDELLTETHARGMKLILDLVINHTSDEHPWFIESRSSKDNPKRDWYIWRDGKGTEPPNNWESIFSGSAWKYDTATEQYYMHLFAIKQPDLNWENEEVRTELYKMVNWWLDKGIDGFRVDAISHIKKREGFPDMPNPDGQQFVSSFDMHTNQPGIQTFLSELKEETFSKYDIMTVGEANGVGIEEADEWVGESNGKFSMIFQFEHLGLWNKDANKSVDVIGLKKTLTKWQKGLHERGWNALFLENHDQTRSVSSWGNDQEYWNESAKMLGACYFLMQGTPFIYQGQEIGMTNVQLPSIDDYDDIGMRNFYEIEIAKGRPHLEVMETIWTSGRDNSRTPMQWDNTDNAGFTTGTPWMKVNPNYSSINVEAQLKDEHSIYHFFKSMIKLRKEHEVFVYGAYDLLLETDPDVYVYTRYLDNVFAVILCNFRNKTVELDLHEVEQKDYRLVLSNFEGAPQTLTKKATLKPYETRVYLSK